VSDNNIIKQDHKCQLQQFGRELGRPHFGSPGGSMQHDQCTFLSEYYEDRLVGWLVFNGAFKTNALGGSSPLVLRGWTYLQCRCHSEQFWLFALL